MYTDAERSSTLEPITPVPSFVSLRRHALRAGGLRPVSWALLVAALLAAGCALIAGPQPRPGLFDYQAALHRPVPGGIVNVAGGNLVVPRVDLTLDTVFGRHVVGAHYNSTSFDGVGPGRWTWSFEMTYDGSIFVDETGARHVLRDVAAGAAVPGTHWVKIDSYRIKTKGGLQYTFHPGTHQLYRISWAGGEAWPHVAFVADPALGDGRPGSVVQCRGIGNCAPMYEIERDANGCVSGIEDRAARRVEVVADASCRALVVRDPLAVDSGWAGRRYTYDAGRLASQTSSEGERVEYAYANAQLVEAKSIGAGDPTVRLAYASGYGVGGVGGLNVAEVEDAEGAVTVYHYDMQARLHARIDALGDESRWTWEGRRPITFVDAAGVETRWVYADDDPVARYEPSGNVVQITYAPAARNPHSLRRRAVERVEDSLGVRAIQTYAPDGRLETLTNGAGETSQVLVDGQGLMARFTDPAGIETRFEGFGEHGHPARVSRDPVFEHRLYDAVGNRTEGEDAFLPLAPGRPGVVRNRFDANRNLAGITLRGGTDSAPSVLETAEVEIDYRSDGQPLRTRRPYGGDIERDYDAIGRLVAERERVDGQWRTTTYAWDRAGRLIGLTRPNGMAREIDYDLVGRPVAVRLLRAGVVEKTLALEYAAGRLVAQMDSTRPGVEAFHYDAAGRVDRVTYPGGEVRETRYDLRSREIERRYRLAPGAPPLRTLAFAYDGADRTTAISEDGVAQIERIHADGRLSEERFANALVRTYAYDPEHGRLEATTMFDWENEVVESTSIEITACSITEACLLARTSSIADPSEGVDAYTQEAYVFPAPAGIEVETDRPGPRLEAFAATSIYDVVPNLRRNNAFDVLGNWIGRGAAGGYPATSEFTYNAERNRLVARTSAPATTYAYDAAGFLMSRGSTTLAWDAGGRIAAIGTELEFEWDVLGRPVSRREGVLETRTLFGGQIQADANGLPLSLDLGALRIDLVSGAHRYRHTDFRGNVKLVTDDAGLPVLHYAYSGFGVEARLGDDPDTMQFAGGHAVGGFVLLGARLYDPEVGRFISPDPIPHAINTYAYTLGNPAHFWDPDGLTSVPTAAPGVDGAAGASGVGGAGANWASADTANALVLLGTVVVGGSIGAGNGIGVGIGVAIWGTGVVMNALTGGEQPSPEPRVPPAVPAPPPTSGGMSGEGGTADGGGEASAESSSGASVCAPTRLAEAPIARGPLVALTLVHVFAAAVWVARQGRRS